MTLTIDNTSILEEAIREVEEHDAQIVVERGGYPVAVLVSPRFLKMWQMFAEELENRMDLEAYREAKREREETGEQPVSYEEFRKELGF